MIDEIGDGPKMGNQSAQEPATESQPEPKAEDAEGGVATEDVNE